MVPRLSNDERHARIEHFSSCIRGLLFGPSSALSLGSHHQDAVVMAAA